jgi:hypothetical protein
LEVSYLASRSAEGLEMKAWITELYMRWLHHKKETFAISIEQQIREQLQQQYGNYIKGLKDSLIIADSTLEYLRERVTTQENLISELKTSQGFTQKPKRIQRRKPSRKGKRV